MALVNFVRELFLSFTLICLVELKPVFQNNKFHGHTYYSSWVIAGKWQVNKKSATRQTWWDQSGARINLHEALYGKAVENTFSRLSLK